MSNLERLLHAIAGEAKVEQRRDGLWLTAPALDEVALARELLAAGARLSTMTGVAAADGETEIIYHYALGGTALNIKTRTRQGQLPSITGVTPAAAWIEREIHDLFAVEFTGHPDLARLVRPPELPVGFFRAPAT